MAAAATNTFDDVKAVVMSAHKNTSTKDKVTFYNSWANSYEQLCTLVLGQDVAVMDYRAPKLAASRISCHFSGAPEAASVLDVACGTGLVAKQMKNHGFQHFVGVDGSEGMLELAAQTGLYQDLKLVMLGEETLPDDWVNYFDVVTIVGALSVGQVPVDVIRDLCGTTKPGGYVVMTTRGNQDNLQFKGSLESELRRMEEEGVWKCVEVTEVEDWEKAVSQSEEGYIPGNVYLYQKSTHHS